MFDNIPEVHVWQIDQARKLQAKLMPKKIPDWNCLSFAYEYHSLDPIGGDYLDFFDIKGNKKGLLIADVSGHGMPAAIITAMAKMSFSNHAMFSDSPREIFQKVNQDIYRFLGDSGLYLTAFLMVIDQNLNVKYSSAGHPPVIYYSNKADKFLSLKTKGLFIGVFEDAWETYEEGEMQLQAGDRIVLYTDGLVESRNLNNEQYGLERVESTVRFSCALPAEKLAKMILTDVKEYCQNVPFHDDISVLIVDLSLKFTKFKHHYDQGKELFTRRNSDWVEEFEKAAQFNKDNIEILFYLGKYYYEKEMFDKAKEYFERLITNRIVAPEIYQFLTQILIKEKKFMKAIAMLKEIMKDYPDYKDGIYNLAYCYYNLGWYEKSLEVCNDYKEKYPAELSQITLLTELISKNMRH